MNRKQFIVLLVLVLVLGGAAWWHYRKQTAGWNNQSPELGQKLLGDFQVNDVAQIRIQQGTNDLTLAKTNGLWCVAQRDDYPANFSQISQFLLKLRDLKIIQTEEVGPSQLPRLESGGVRAGDQCRDVAGILRRRRQADPHIVAGQGAYAAEQPAFAGRGGCGLAGRALCADGHQFDHGGGDQRSVE